MASFGIKSRFIEREFENYFFKPRGIPLTELEIIQLGHEELEAIRLIDVEHMNQQDAAVKMNVSRATMQRIINGAREKVGRTLIRGLGMEIAGGHYTTKGGYCQKKKRCR